MTFKDTVQEYIKNPNLYLHKYKTVGLKLQVYFIPLSSRGMKFVIDLLVTLTCHLCIRLQSSLFSYSLPSKIFHVCPIPPMRVIYPTI